MRLYFETPPGQTKAKLKLDDEHGQSMYLSVNQAAAVFMGLREYLRGDNRELLSSVMQINEDEALLEVNLLGPRVLGLSAPPKTVH